MLEASGGLTWNDQNDKLSPPVETLSFGSLSDHYLSAIRMESDPLKQRIRLFETYLSEAKFVAAEGLLFSMDAAVAAGLRERLAGRLADHLLSFEFGNKALEGELELAVRLGQDYPDSFGLQLACEIQTDQWKEAGSLVRHGSQSLSVADKNKYLPAFFTALDSQISSLLESEQSIDQSAGNVPSTAWLLASALNQVSLELEGLMGFDRLLGFSAEVEKPTAEKLLDRLESTSWTTEPFLNEVLAMLRDVDPGGMVFPWLEALDQELSPDPSEAPRLWRLRARLFQHLGLFDQAFAAADLRLDALATDNSPANIRESKSWLRWKEDLLRKIEAPAAEIDAVVEQFKSIPKRPSGLDPKMIDLTDYYVNHLFETPDLGRLPETFTPRHGVDFDLRGVFQIAAGSGPRAELPEKIEGIPVQQKSEAIHFLIGAMGGNDLDQIEIAKIIVHLDDGTSSTIPLVNKLSIADWFQWFDHYRLTADQTGWSGRTRNPWSPGTVPCALVELVWKNPFPEKSISHLDFVSTKTKSSLFVVAITLE
jgi:hypothetical protein